MPSSIILRSLRLSLRSEPMRLLIVLALLPAPSLAAGFTPPAGCETHMTVQSRQCRVSNYYTCAADPAGDQWRIDADQQGPFFASRINSEAEWVESFGMEAGTRQKLSPGAKDPASFSSLVATGSDSYDFWLEHEGGTRTHVTGRDTLTGRSTTIDGITLPETDFEFTEVDEAGTVLRQSRGQEYIHPEWRNFFAGPSEIMGEDGWMPMNGSPVEFIFPGEPGFRASQPIFDCDDVMSQLVSPEGGRS